MVSCNGEVVAEEEMDGGDVPVCMDDVQPVELRVFILNAILFQCLLHVQRPAQPLPDVAPSMFIELQVTVQYLSDRLLSRNFQNGAVVVDHVDDAYPPRLLGEPTNDILGVLPPLHLALGIHMQVSSCGTVKFSTSSLEVDADSWLAAVSIEPIGDISACSLDEGSGQRIRNVLLDDSRQIIDLPEEDDPAIICNVVA